MVMDYKKILTAYIDHVGNWEGVDFLHYRAPSSLTAEEVVALYECANRDEEGEYLK